MEIGFLPRRISSLTLSVLYCPSHNAGHNYMYVLVMSCLIGMSPVIRHDISNLCRHILETVTYFAVTPW